MYYTATWIYYGAFQEGYPPYFDLEEFFASAGCRFLYYFLVTVPIVYVVMKRIFPRSPWMAYASHLFFLPLFTVSVYLMLSATNRHFGWVFMWDETAMVWTLYLIAVFYLLQFLLIHAYQYHQVHQTALKEKAELKEVALQSQITAWKAQLNPHFLHNLFNSINASIPAENERTRELVIALSDLFRYQNTASQKDLVPLRDEIGFIKNYLDLMKVRLKDRLQVQISVDDDLLSSHIPPMILQPLVENAITHGVSPKVGASKVSLMIKRMGDRIKFEITDTGVGIKPDTDFWNKGLGLKNTRERLKHLYHADLRVEPNPPQGTKVSFVI